MGKRRKFPEVPRYIEEEAGEIGTPGEARRRALAKRVRDMDPPTRAAAAVRLAVQGASYPDIAQVLDYRTPMEAKAAVWDAIADLNVDYDDVDRMRTLQAQRLDRLLYAVMPKATDTEHPEQVTYGRFALAILDRQAKLQGLDAAAAVVVYTPTQKEIAAHAERVTQLMRTAAGAIEADIIIDAEIVEEAGDAAPRTA